ncbi:PAS domain S-box protein [Desulfobacterales bacterium HSG2]|nr:PAS domain S-box protein [Desulfobacterales bacterium HSG2]
MRLRLILLVLSLLAFLSASAGGYLYYSSLREAAHKEAETRTVSRLEMIKKNLSFFLSENIKPVKTLAGMRELGQALIRPSGDSLSEANVILDHFKETLNVEVCYLTDHEGNTIASSNRNSPDSFVGENFAFRPYFRKGIRGLAATYLALGTASERRGAYYSHPVYGEERDAPAGLAVIKASIDLIEKELNLNDDEIVLVTDPSGIVFISSREEWLYTSLKKLSSEEMSQIASSLQFGEGPWLWTGLETKGQKYSADRSGNEYLTHRSEIDNYPGWHVIHLQSLRAISKRVSDPLIQITGDITLMLSILVGISVFILYRRASCEIIRRKRVEKALRESEERYRAIYHNAPAMLHSINNEGDLVRVSDHWLKALGYTDKNEVIGQKLSRFLTEDSGRYLEEVIIPEFFKTGFCNEVPYQFVKKDGGIIEVLLSAIGERDADGNIVRSLAVSIDVTERKHAEESLKRAKEELSIYSKDLERQVKKRTEEISSILKYTPNVVYIKDREGRYLLINSRYEDLFGVKNEEIRGKTDYDIHPGELAEQFRAGDMEVLSEGCSSQSEEIVPHTDGSHTYLSVKFPIYNESGAASGVGGISADITETKKAQDQLRRLSGNIMARQEKERAAIARELHDELGQILTALRMDSVWLKKRLEETDAKAAERSLTMCDLIDQTIEDVRGIAMRLRPGVLDNLGLVDALEWFTADFERRTGITCIFEHFNVPMISGEIATSAYRIAQESLTNVARHADASRTEVLLKVEDGVLTLTVVDDGLGFSTSDLAEAEGLGVAGMRERAALVRGVLDVQSMPGEGTRVYFKLKIED